MAQTVRTTGEGVELKRVFEASRPRVFEAWTRPEWLKQWAAPGPLETPVAEVDLRVGGAYRMHMRAPDGTEHRVRGKYLEVDPPRRLVYTWSWETDDFESVVTVEFHERGAATEIVLRHEGFPSADRRDRHEEGRTGCLEKFPAVLAAQGDR